MINYYQLNLILYSDFWRKLWFNVPFLLGNTCRCHGSLNSLGVTVSQTFLACDVFWQFWRVLVMLYRMFFTIIWLVFFLYIVRLELWGVLVNKTRDQVPLASYQNCTINMRCMSSFSIIKLHLFTLHILRSSEGSHYAQLTLE